MVVAHVCPWVPERRAKANLAADPANILHAGGVVVDAQLVAAVLDVHRELKFASFNSGDLGRNHSRKRRVAFLRSRISATNVVVSGTSTSVLALRSSRASRMNPTPAEIAR